MKWFLVVVAILFLLNNYCFAQQHKAKKNIPLPSTVKAAFIEKYPNSGSVHWKRKDDEYEAQWANGRSVIIYLLPENLLRKRSQFPKKQ